MNAWFQKQAQICAEGCKEIFWKKNFVNLLFLFKTSLRKNQIIEDKRFMVQIFWSNKDLEYNTKSKIQ